MKRAFMDFMDAYPLPEPAPLRRSAVLSPYLPYIARTPALIVAFFLIMGGTAYAAEQSLPDELLYPVKTGVIEPLIIEAPARTPLAKAQASHKLVVRRLEEAEQLVDQGRMNAKTATVIAEAVKEHTEETHAHIAEATAAGELTAALSIETSLESSLEAHGQVLETLIASSTSADHADAAPEDTAATQNLIDQVSVQANAAADVGTAVETQTVSALNDTQTTTLATATQQAAQAAIDDLRSVMPASTPDNQALVDDADALLTQADTAYASGVDLLSNDKTDDALAAFRDAIQAVQKANILLDSSKALSN